MIQLDLTAAVIAAIAASVISLLCSYFPGLSTKFAALASETKQLIMAGAMVVVSVVVYALNCWGVLATGISCDKQGIFQLVFMLISAIVANQGVYQLSPQTNAVERVKDDREVPPLGPA